MNGFIFWMIICTGVISYMLFLIASEIHKMNKREDRKENQQANKNWFKNL